MFKKLLVANRGEIAVRIIRACKELGVRTVAVYSEADRGSPYVSQAEESYGIGPAPAAESYLRGDRILQVAARSGAQAIHPGYGFLAENALFAEGCRKAGLVFIGPRAATLRSVGDKIAARKVAHTLGIPIAPGLGAPATEARVRTFARRHGYPVLLKAAGGGGGKGLRIVRDGGDLGGALRDASGEADRAFGDPTLLVEKLVQRPRHVEVQILGDSRGQLIHLGERECSIQRRHQKLIEESPALAVDPGLLDRMAEAALRIARAVGYENAGTCEFLLDDHGRFLFIEVNPRLQVEHPVTEMVTGLDLVHLQLRVAAGERLPLGQDEVRRRGHALEFRICAEDPFTNFRPATGEVRAVRFPAGPFVRIDSDLGPRSQVTTYYDSLLAKLICWAPDREGAIARASRALREFQVVGVQTTLPFHLQLLQDRRFRTGRVHTRYVEEQFRLKKPSGAHSREAALLAAALEFLRRREEALREVPSQPLPAWLLAYRGDER